jgi:hypothetical protein
VVPVLACRPSGKQADDCSNRYQRQEIRRQQFHFDDSYLQVSSSAFRVERSRFRVGVGSSASCTVRSEAVGLEPPNPPQLRAARCRHHDMQRFVDRIAIQRSSNTVEGQIERKDVDAWFTQYPQLSAFGVSLYQLLHLFFGDVSRFRDPRNLIVRRSGRDVRIEAGA